LPVLRHPSGPDEFLADQLPRLDAAMEAAAEQYAHQALEDMLSKAFGKPTGPRSRSGCST
jgi:hypothetical protein